MNEQDEGAARAVIANVIARYNNCGDRGRIEDLDGVFAPDAVYELPDHRMNGLGEIVGFLSGVVTRGAEAGPSPRKRVLGGRHHTTTSRIEFMSASEAEGWTYFFVMAQGTVLLEGLYIDRFARTDDGWRIAHRRAKIVWEHEPRAG